MSPAFLAVIAVILCILFRILNVSSTPQIPSIVCKDGQFMECFNKIAPMLREPHNGAFFGAANSKSKQPLRWWKLTVALETTDTL
uniref:Secreted protein n=1 Tax=Anopheles quadriannulatus TaxID=34691 RepID=A0A182WRT0_ANOQN